MPQQGLTIKQYAAQARQRFPEDDYLTDREISKRYLRIYPQHKASIDPSELSDLYSIQADQRGSDTQFSVFTFKEMLGSMPAAAVGTIGAITGSKDIIKYSEELRMKALEDTRERLNDPELQGYLKWIEDEPISLKNFYQPQMFQRGFAQAAPSIASMLAVDIGLNAITYGIGGTALRAARLGGGGFKAMQAAKKSLAVTKAKGKALSTAEKAVQASERLSTVGTMGFMGALEGSETYNETMSYLLKQGVDVEQANKISAIAGASYGVAASIEEYIPYGRFKRVLGVGSARNRMWFAKNMTRALKKRGAWQKGRIITKEMINQSMAESAQEYTQYMTQQLVDYYVRRGYDGVPDSALEYLQKHAATPEAVESAYAGGVMGLTMGFVPGFKMANMTKNQRVAQVMSEIKDDKDLPPSAEEDKIVEEAAKKTRTADSRIKLNAFIGSFTNLTPEEKEIARSLTSDLADDEVQYAHDIIDIIENEPELLDELTEEQRFDVLEQINEIDPDVDIESLEQRWEESLESLDDEGDLSNWEERLENLVEEDEPDGGFISDMDYDDIKNEDVKEILDTEGLAKALLEEAPDEEAEQMLRDGLEEMVGDDGIGMSTDIDPQTAPISEVADNYAWGLGLMMLENGEKSTGEQSGEFLNFASDFINRDKWRKIAEPKKDETKAPLKDKPTKKPIAKDEIDRVKVSYTEETGEISVTVDDEIVDDLSGDELDKLQSGIAKAKAQGDESRLDEARLSILNRVKDEPTDVKDEPTDEPKVVRDEPVSQEEEEKKAIEMTTKPKEKKVVHQKMPRKKTYEVTTAGDARFSAYNAMLDGKSIEHHYQVGVKGYRTIKEGKGKPPKDPNTDLDAEYQALWDRWAKENPDLIEELRELSKGKKLTDKFATKPGAINQATALTRILERKKVEDAVEAKTRAETPEVFEEGDETKETFVGKIEDLAEELGKQIYDFLPSDPNRKKPPTSFEYGQILTNFIKSYNEGKLLKSQKEFYEKKIKPQLDIAKESLSKDYEAIEKGTSPEGVKRKEALKKAEKAFEGKSTPKKDNVKVAPLKEIPGMEDRGEGVNTLRKGKTFTQQFGNPFSYKENTYALIKVPTREQAIEFYDEWLRTGDVKGKKFTPKQKQILDEQRAWMLEQIDSGFLDGKSLLYFQSTEDNHAKRLDAFIQERSAKKETPDDGGFTTEVPEDEMDVPSKEEEEAEIRKLQEEEADRLYKDEADENKKEKEEASKSASQVVEDQREKRKEDKKEDSVKEDLSPEKKKGRQEILDSRQDSKTFEYSKDQETALMKIADWLLSRSKEPFIFAGFAGTGKTTLVENIVNFAKSFPFFGKQDDAAGMTVNVAAPTNRAVDVLEQKAEGKYNVNHGTLHQLLYTQFNKETRQWEKRDKDYDETDLIIIDESSMIGIREWEQIKKEMINKGARVIFIGDTFQLEPVKQDDPKILQRWRETGYQMTKVLRQAAKSGIIKWATALRIKKGVLFPNEDTDDVKIEEGENIKSLYFKDLSEGKDSIIIVASNKVRKSINQESRKSKFKKENPDILEKGETLISISNSALRKNGQLFGLPEFSDLSEPVTIKYEDKYGNTAETKLYAYYDDNGTPQFIAPFFEEASLTSHMIETESMDLLKKKFPEHMRTFKDTNGVDVAILGELTNINTYGYAITAHKSQGGQWENVYIYETNASWSYGTDTSRARWLYTAITRASGKIFVSAQEVKNAGQTRSGEEIAFIGHDSQSSIENDKTNEKLQEIAKGQRIDNNKQLAAKIAKRLKKQFPFITAKAVEKVYDRFGREVAGRAIDNMVEWSLTKGTLDTIPHEYAHIYIDLLRDSPIVQKGIQLFRIEGDTLDRAEERLVQYIGEYYANRMQGSLYKRVGLWLRQFWLNIKKYFGKLKIELETKEQVGEYLAEKFYQDSMSKQTAATTGVERLQGIAPRSEAWEEALTSINEGYKRFINYLNDAEGFSVAADSAQESRDILIHKYVTILKQGEFNEIFDEVLEVWQDKKGYSGIEHRNQSEFDDHVEFFDNLWESLNKNLSSINTKDTQMNKMNKINSQFRKGFGTVSNKKMGILTTQARNSTFEDFVEVSAILLKKPIENIDSHQKKDMRTFYESVRNQVKTNRENENFNQRTFYTMEREFLEDGTVVIRIERKKSKNKNKRSNPQWDRNLLIENIADLGDIVWIKGGDIKDIFHRSDWMNPAIQWTEEKDAYNPLSYNDLLSLRNLVKPMGMTIAFNRGERPNYALVKITEDHKEKASRAEEYWEGENVSNKQRDNFLGKKQEEKGLFKNDAARDSFRAEQIARHEAMKKIFPGYLQKQGGEVFKRIKIPLTPTISSDDMPNAVGRIFNKEKSSFVITDENGDKKVVDGMVNVEGQSKYRLDGSSLTSTRLFNEFIKWLGMDAKTSKAKTVIAAIVNNSKLFVKHQHFKPLHPVQIYENYGRNNEKLIATIDENGFIYGVNNEHIDILMTEDEAKAYDGDFAVDDTFIIPGQQIGFINMPRGRHDKAKHAQQLYNYIHTKSILDLWKTQIFPTMRERVRRAFTMARSLDGENPQGKIRRFMEVLVGNDSTLDSVPYELFKLGLGMHRYGSTMLDKLVQTQIIDEALQGANMPGLNGDTIVDFTDTLAYDEVGVPMSDASVIISDYMSDKGMRPEERKDVTMAEVNNWLSENDYNMLISRSPIPHIGGARMVKVKRLHDNNNQIEVNWLLLFKDLEGDGDGDKVQLEKLPKPLEEEFIKLYDEIKVDPINLNKYTKDSATYDLSNMSDLYKLMEAITYGNRAIGEISNIQLGFGILQEVFNHIEIETPKGEKYQLKIRQANDRVTDEKSGITDTADNILRIYLQAAVDNAEFLLLKGWEYEQGLLASNLFYRSDGKALTEGDMEYVNKLMSKVKEISYSKYGRDYDVGKYGLKDSITRSNQYLIFVRDRAKIMIQDIGQTKEAKITDIDFKLGQIHPHEMIATAVAELYDGYKRPGEDGSPYILSEDVYHSAHLDAVNQMREDMRDEFTGILDKDAIRGVDYARQMYAAMTDMFRQLETQQDRIGGWDTNGDMVDFAEEWSRRYNLLTPLERRAATYSFLQGVERLSGGKLVPVSEIQRGIPPVSSDPLKLSLLDHTIMSKYFDLYNGVIQDERKRAAYFKKPLQSRNVERVGIEAIVTASDKDQNRHC